MIVGIQGNSALQSGRWGRGDKGTDSMTVRTPARPGAITPLHPQVPHFTGETLIRLASQANIELHKDMKPEEITFEVVMDLLRRQYVSVLWTLPPDKSALGAQPREYDHHTLMLIKRLLY